MKLQCPVITCGADNGAPITTCSRCGADLRAYAIALKLPDLYFNRGLSLANAGDYGTARTALGLCLGLRPDDEEALLLYGKVCWAMGDKAAARQSWEQVQMTATDNHFKEIALECLPTVDLDLKKQPVQRQKRRKR